MLQRLKAPSSRWTFLLAGLVHLTLFSYSSAQDISLATVKGAFDSADIPTDANVTFNPQTLLEVSFTQSAGTPPVNVTAGNAVARNATASPPVFGDRFANNSTNVSQFAKTKFVLAMIDLDAPTPQDRSLSQVRHFLGADFTLNQTSGGDLLFTNSSPALSEYVQPSPPPQSDPHRYVFFLFTQPSNFTTTAAKRLVNASTPITNFNISVFAAKMGLGSPIGGTFMKVGPSSSNTTTSGSGNGNNTTSSPTTGKSGAVSQSTSAFVGLTMAVALAMSIVLAVV